MADASPKNAAVRLDRASISPDVEHGARRGRSWARVPSRGADGLRLRTLIALRWIISRAEPAVAVLVAGLLLDLPDSLRPVLQP